MILVKGQVGFPDYRLFFSVYSSCPMFGCWSPKCNNCPKCNKVLNVIIFGPKCNKALNVITFGPKCNKPPMQSFNCANIEMLK